MITHRQAISRTRFRRRVSSILAILAFAGAAITAPAVLACGYHDPQHVARGLLNWVYPNALHVRTAVWMAEDAGVLPPRPPQKARDMFAYQKMAYHLEELGDRLSGSLDTDNAPVTFAAVLLDSMLWIRFVPTPEGYSVKVHADGAETDDIVVVTHGKVIKALARGRLEADTAEDNGLIRLYRNDGAHDRLRLLLSTATASNSLTEKVVR